MASSTWQKSSYSGATDNCVEVRTGDGLVQLRESDCADIVVCTTPARFVAFLHGAKAGEFDHHATPTN